MSKRKIDKQIDMLPSYDIDVYKGVISKTDEIKENSMVKKALSKTLGVKVDMKLETGETVIVTIADILAAETIKDAIQNPSTSKLKDLAAITGDLKENVDMNLRTPLQLFGDLVIQKNE